MSSLMQALSYRLPFICAKGENMYTGKRITLKIKEAIKQKRLQEVLA